MRVVARSSVSRTRITAALTATLLLSSVDAVRAGMPPEDESCEASDAFDLPADSATERPNQNLRVWVSLPNGNSLNPSDDHEPLVAAAIALLQSASVELPYTGTPDPTLNLRLSPARDVTFSLSDTGKRLDQPRTVKVSRLVIDIRNVFGPDGIVVQINGVLRRYAEYQMREWVAFRRELDRVTFLRRRPVVPAVGQWSKSVQGLQARLAVDNWRDPMIGVYLELKNTRSLADTVTIPIDANDMVFELRDEDGEEVPSPGLPRSGPVADLKDFRLPYDSSLRCNLSVSTVGIPSGINAMIALRSHAWFLKPTDSQEYQLSGSFRAEPRQQQPQADWHGELKIPPVVIRLAPRTQVPDRTVSRNYTVRPSRRQVLRKTIAALFQAENNVQFEPGKEAHQLQVIASESRQTFIAELIDALQHGSTSAQPNAARLWLRHFPFPQNDFTFVRVRSSRFWATDYPDADIGLSERLARSTSLNVDPDGEVLELTDERLGAYPFIYLVEGGRLILSDEEVTGLRKYLTSGGFLMADDFWGEAEWRNVKTQLKRVFPDLETVDLPLTHPIFHCVFDFTEKPQVCSIAVAFQGRSQGITWERADGKEVHYRGLVDRSGRLMAVLCHNTDLGDGWERGHEDPWYAKEFSEKRAFPMGVNIVFYALTH